MKNFGNTTSNPGIQSLKNAPSHAKLLLLLLLSHFSRVRLCVTPIDSSPPGSPIAGILQVRTLEWVAISFSNPWKWKVKVKSLSRLWLFETPWTVAYQAPPSVGLSRQDYWSGLPLPSPFNCINTVQRVRQKFSWVKIWWFFLLHVLPNPICIFGFYNL